MSLTVKHLNADASFYLSFKPLLPFPPSPEHSTKEFTILLDPWISGNSTIFHSKFSMSKFTSQPCITSLTELPEPDVVIISQNKSDHCNQPTLTQLPKSGGKTVIVAEPASAKRIRGWKHFAPEKVITLRKWEEKAPATIHRIAIPALSPLGDPGEVTIAYIPQKIDITALHNAIAITYRAPTFGSGPSFALPMTPPASPMSSSTFVDSKSSSDRTLSVIFSPHGCSYKTLAPYVTSHLISEAALPLTALLHCFDRVDNTWYLGGNICRGFPGGVEITQKLCPRVWISAHDGDKEVTGLATKKIAIEKYDREQVESVVSPRSDKFPSKRVGPEVVVLKAGEDYVVSGTTMDFGPDGS